MIKANELRVGNIFAGCSPARSIGKVLTIIRSGVEAEYQLVGYGAARNNPGIGFAKFEDLFGIPLTEEWLVKLGLTRYARAKDYIEAEENHSLDFVDLEDWTVYCAGSSGFFVGLKDGKLFHVEDHAAFDERAYIFPLGVELKSVHALQNRFYSMTGEELTIKEPA